MQFIVRKQLERAPKIEDFPQAVLTQDNWDDYGYKTTFHARLHLSPQESVDLGTVKILKNDTAGGYTPMPRDPFQRLDNTYASLAANLDYYEQLFKQGRQIYDPYLRGMRDVTYSDDIKARFEDLEGFRVSLLRVSGAQRTISDAEKLFRTSKLSQRRSAGFRVKFKTRISSSSNTFLIEFDFRRRRSLPSRVNVVIGYNGTGKTRLLSNLAVVASGYGYKQKEDILDNSAGRFVESQPPFKTVIVVSYSAFDTFVIPGRTEEERERLSREGEIFGYVYCGLREHVAGDNGEATYRLKTPAENEEEFQAALQRIRASDRSDALIDVLKPLLSDASFQRIGLAKLFRGDDDDGFVDLFREMSSGHKAVLKIAAELTAYMSAREPTLVLIDEPETHLHPPLLASFLKSIRVCLEKFDGYAVIATHSPVVLQETPSRFAHVIRRTGDHSQVNKLSIETFGESISLITQEVFNLDDGTTDWHETLKALAQKRELGEIEEIFGRPLGFSPRSYVLSVRDEQEE